MKPRALRVALTGGIATGKSHCLNLFISQGFPIIDADSLAHNAIAPGTDGAAAVMAAFGTIDRTKLGQIVFKDPAARRALEAIIHPRVYEGIEKWFRGLTGSAPVGIADIPLLFESGRERDFDRIVITSCRRDQQQKRLMDRGLTAAEADARIDSQLTLEEKLARAKAAGLSQMVDVVDTSGTFKQTDRQVFKITDVLGSLPPRVCS